jgi:signal transduction histidine kinase
MKLRDLPITQKFLVAMLLVTLSSLGITCSFLIAMEWRTFRESRLDDARTVAGIIAANSATSLIFSDEKVAVQILSGIRAQPVAVASALYDARGELFAHFPTNLPASAFPARPQSVGTIFQGKKLEAFDDVTVEGKYLGSAYVRFDVTPMYQRFRLYVGTVLAVAAGCVALAILLSNLLQRWIARPVIELSRTAASIADGNYSLRASKHGTDEVGQLVDAFNHMVTEIESSQGKLKNYAADLERDVAQRTGDLVKTVNDLESFSYSVSHDMRAPLRAMQGYAQILMEEHATELSPEAKVYLERIRRAATRLDTLIQDILTYSRIARSEMTLRPIDLDKFIADVIAEYPQLTAPGVTIDIQHPLGRVIAHDAALSQVLSNLLSNAVKFVAPGQSPSLKVFSTIHNDKVRVSVSDRGLGIPEKDLERIFRIFERVHDNKAFEGTGIGLSIVKRAVERMGGNVGVTSQPGVGSTFWFELNRANDESSNEEARGGVRTAMNKNGRGGEI